MALHAREIRETVKQFLLDQFLPGESPDALTPSTPLITGGILDSIATVKLVSFLEGTYGIEFQAHEMSPANLDTLDAISRTVESKIAEK